MTTALRRLQLRIEQSCEKFGASYPWWIPTCSTAATVAIAVSAWVQRGGPGAPLTVQVALLLAASSLLLWLPRAWMTPPWLEAMIVVGAVALFLTEPVTPDLAPLLFLMTAGEVAAVSRGWIAGVVAAVDVAVVCVAGGVDRLENVGLYAIGVVLAASVGVALRWQMRALRAERTNTLFAQESALSTERQRLAREVHDVVGHSLSINLLHVTAARHALQKHADIADAIESLVEAERVGRAAMGDLRRTVAVLAAAPGDAHPLPGLDDLAVLIERSRDAGLDVTYACDGDPSRLSDAAGLGLYRIAQESLGNIARHAPTSTSAVSLRESALGVRLTIENSLPDGVPAHTSDGSGLPGMAARAEQLGAELRAGVDGDRWLVDVVVPAPLDRRSTVPA